MFITREEVKKAIETACLSGLNPLESKWLCVNILLDVLNSDDMKFNSDSEQKTIKRILTEICPHNTRNNEIKDAILLAMRNGANPFSVNWSAIEDLVDMYDCYEFQKLKNQTINILLLELFPEKE
jgi:hypothetical protein